MTIDGTRRVRRLHRTALALLVGLAVGGPAIGTAPVAAATSQSLTFLPPLTASVGSSIALHATAGSGLTVGFSTTTPAICTLSGATVSFIAIGTCSVKATQAGDATWAPVSSTKLIAVARAYRAVAVASRGGVARTDGSIRIGDDLSIRFSAVDTAVTSCLVVIYFRSMMLAQGLVRPDGSCTIDLVLPELTIDGYPDELCISDLALQFADGTSSSSEDPNGRRVMHMADRTMPGGVGCASVNGEQAPEVIDFLFSTGGTPRPFTSTPSLLSWNPTDWDPGFVPLRFNTPWNVEFPDWIERCNRPVIDSSPAIHLGAQVESVCDPWSLQLPGILPAAMPGGAYLETWRADLYFRYIDERGQLGVTMVPQEVPMEPSEGVFSSSVPGIFPTDVAVARFVNANLTWRPRFQISGTEPTSCVLRLFEPGAGGADPGEEFVGSIDGEGVCSFSIGGFDEPNVEQQYWVTFDDGVNEGQFTSLIVTIPASSAPTIPDPLPGTGETTFRAVPGAGQGMSLALTVEPQAAAAGSIAGAEVIAADAETAGAAGCAATTFTPDLDSGGGLPNAVAECGFVSGTFVVTARMVDAAGIVRTRTRTITLVPDSTKPTTTAPRIAYRTGASLSGSSAPIRLTWSGADAGGSGIARYELARSTNGGTSWSVISNSITSASRDLTLSSLGTIRYRVRAIDKAGNVGAWATGPNVTPKLSQQTSTLFAYGGTWNTGTVTSYSGGTSRWSNIAGSRATFTFTGRAIGLVTTMASKRGKVKVYVDGVYITTVDTYSATTKYRALVWQRTWTVSGTHTVRFVVVGTAGRPRVDIDAVTRH